MSQSQQRHFLKLIWANYCIQVIDCIAAGIKSSIALIVYDVRLCLWVTVIAATIKASISLCNDCRTL